MLLPESSFLQELKSLYDSDSGGWRLPGWLDQPCGPEMIEIWRRTMPLNYACVEREVGDLYQTPVANLKPRVVLETGTNIGYSTLCIADSMNVHSPNGIIYTIDVRPGYHLFDSTISGQLVKFVLGNSLGVSLADLGVIGGAETFDMLVLDSDHTYGTVARELNRYLPLLKTGGVAILHDSMFFDGIAVVVRELARFPAVEVLSFRTPRRHVEGTRCPGITLVRKVGFVPGDLIKIPAEIAGLEFNLPGRTAFDAPLI